MRAWGHGAALSLTGDVAVGGRRTKTQWEAAREDGHATRPAAQLVKVGATTYEGAGRPRILAPRGIAHDRPYFLFCFPPPPLFSTGSGRPSPSGAPRSSGGTYPVAT